MPAAIVAVVDIEKVTSGVQCLQDRCGPRCSARQRAAETAQKALATPLQTEQKSIQAAVDALKGKEPDAALQARVKSFQTRAAAGAAGTASAAGSSSSATRPTSSKQISDKLGPIYQQVMQRRGANLMVEVGTTLAHRRRSTSPTMS